jgi:hypothetical protein
MQPFKNFFYEQKLTTVGFFPGAFKPPHVGHYETARQLAEQNKAAYVLVSGKDREGITTDKSLKVWQIYKKYLPSNLQIFAITGSPVLTIYQTVDIINNGQFSATERSPAPTPDAAKLSDTIQTLAAPYEVNLYASQEDIDRFKYFFDPSKSTLYKGKNVKTITARDISRLASATNTRQQLQARNFDEVAKLLPNISAEDKKRVYNILIS